jgi:serine/threonine protein kinase
VYDVYDIVALLDPADFGLAKRCTMESQLKTYCGTPQYFAPEVLRQRTHANSQGYGPEADMVCHVNANAAHSFHATP